MAYVVVFVFIVLDFVTGLVKGVATNSFSSSAMREGLYKKISLVLCMIVSVLVDYAQGFVDLGISIPVAASVCGYICAMEFGSILENICEMNPDIMPERLIALFDITATTDSTDEQTIVTTVSDAVAAIIDAVGTTTQKAADQEDDDTGDDTVADETEDADPADETTTDE